MSDRILDARNLSVDLATAGGMLHAVRGISLHVDRGETLCIVGESGCGKSMTSLALMGLLPPTAVRRAEAIGFARRDLAPLSDSEMRKLRGDRLAMIFQEPMTALNPAYSIGEQLVEGVLVHDATLDRRLARARAVDLLQTCGVGDAGRRLGQYPHQLSGGLRQRVMIAMALMSRPDLLIADEPTTALDVTIQAQILDLLARLRAEMALAVILITHNFDVVRRCADRVAVMYAGEIVETGPLAAVLHKPMHPYTQALLACEPGSAPPGLHTRLGYLPGAVPSLVGDLHGCQFRDRCALAHAACENAVPRFNVEPGHDYLCTLPPDTSRTQAVTTPAIPLAAVTALSKPVIEIRALEINYPVRRGLFQFKGRLAALRGVNMSVQSGEVLGIVGESGSGKSTLARAILGLERPDAGDVVLAGRSVADYKRAELARLVQPIFQDPYSSLNPRRAIAATTRLPLDIHQIGLRGDRDRVVRRMLDLCGLPARLAGAQPSQLSGGQRQRVAIASALVMNPKIVVCDEPTSALDVSVQAQILNLLQDLRAELALTYVLISHDLQVIRCLADTVVVLYLGSVVEEGPTASLFGAPRHPYTQMLLAASSPGPLAATATTEFPNPMAPPSGCAFRTRCPRAQDICAEVAPALRAIAGTRAACHFAEDTA